MGLPGIHDCELPIIITIVNIYMFGHRQDFPDLICAFLKPVIRDESAHENFYRVANKIHKRVRVRANARNRTGLR
jgi:hypothetical protein